MKMQLAETQEMLRASAREFLSESCSLKQVREVRAHSGGFSPDLWKQMAELGWMGLALPEAAGGSGMGLLDLCLLVEEMGHACVPSPFVEAVAGSGLLLAETGGHNDVLRTVATGEAIVVPAFGGLDDDNGHTKLPAIRKDGGRFVIDGAHLFVPYGAVATHFLCLAQGDAVLGKVLLLVPASAPGVTVVPLTSMRDERPCRVDFSGVTVGAGALVASGDETDRLVSAALRHMDVARCFDNAGALAWVLEDTVTYAKDRKQFGQPLAAFQVIQHYCADMHVMLEGLRMSAYHAAWKMSEGLDANRDVAIACAYAHDVIPRYLGIAHQIHGAMGVTIEHDLHLYSTRAFAPGRALAPLSEYLETALTS